MENPIEMDDLGGKPTILGNPHMMKVFQDGQNLILACLTVGSKLMGQLFAWNIVSQQLWNSFFSATVYCDKQYFELEIRKFINLLYTEKLLLSIYLLKHLKRTCH